MPKTVPPLSEAQIRAMEPRAARYSVADGNGLVLEVMPTGSKIWRFRYTLGGKRQPLTTIGDYRRISLRVARERARKYAEMVASGVSPAATARRDRGAEKRVDLLRDAAELYMTTAMASKSEEYQRTTRRALDKDVLRAVGNKPIAAVTPEDVVSICERIKKRGSPKMALHTRNVIKRLYAFLIARQLAADNPASVVPARFIATQDSRTRVLTAGEIGTTLRAIDASGIRRPLKLALHLLVLTMVRKSELIDATWAEFDLKAGLWTIPAARMKNGREHGVYLPRQAVAMLRELREMKSSRTFVFPTVRGEDRPIARSTLNQAVKALGLEVEHFVLHDFRRTAATHLLEMGQTSDAIDVALARKGKEASNDATSESERAPSAEEQRAVLQRWADFVEAQIQAPAQSLITARPDLRRSV
ncbi:tyrosine-type recombinase/integrase [Paraburkholderia sp. BCC1885]|uniref:tyrosine-type recombinase/integrase n=1 Tax=Paraburkholderia sp. BCC1885 TaxID=2562669 RepID=UPI001182A191|nr:tyrosine-type recombinase/integrase [Paraburkholderia sp. BCC1885]